MKICIWHLLPMSLMLLLPDILQADTIGFDVIPRSNQLPVGRGIFVLFDVKFADGYVTAFSAYFNQPAHAFKFQIWRPVEPFIDTETFKLISEISATDSALEKYVIEPLNPIRVEDGDRLGFVYATDGNSPLAATMTATTTNMYYTTSTLSPNIDQSIRFNMLQYPVELSISADYTPETISMGEGPLISGPSGATGVTGPVGATGPIGVKGVAGPPGVAGASGSKGDQGPPGSSGYSGSDGATGPMGPSGATGLRGETGATGPPGPIGRKGVIGPIGQAGPQGSPGSTGSTGATGGPGATGDRGYYGLPGSAGATGATGGTGSTGGGGDRGLPGPIGDVGPPGPPGAGGPPGLPGQKGDRGPLYQDHDECSSEATHGCQHTCINQFGSYTCECDEGYTLQSDGHTCKDVDECSLHNGGCQGTCANSQGSYSCSCPGSTSLGPDGLHCADIRECEVDRGGCEEEESCVDTYGDHYCVLNVPTIYIGNGGTKVTNKDANLVAGTSISSGFSLEDADLLNRNIMIGIIVWLILLSLIILTILLCLCIRKIRENNDTPVYTQPIEGRTRRAESIVYNKDANYY